MMKLFASGTSAYTGITGLGTAESSPVHTVQLASAAHQSQADPQQGGHVILLNQQETERCRIKRGGRGRESAILLSFIFFLWLHTSRHSLHYIQQYGIDLIRAREHMALSAR